MAIPADPFSTVVDLFNQGKHDRAEIACRQLLDEQPRHVPALRILGILARDSQRVAESCELLTRSLAIEPHNALLWFERGNSAFREGRLEAALEDYRQAVKLSPTFFEASLNIGSVCERQRRFHEALHWSRRAVQLRPDSDLAHYNLGNCYRSLGRIRRATRSYQQAIAIRHDYAKAHWNLANCDLLSGNFRAGWAEYEWRQRAGEVFLDRYEQPTWDGSSLAGKTLLVHAEQGIGDEILFASCYPDLLARAGQCIFVCDPRLKALFRRSFPQAKIYGHTRRIDWSPRKVEDHVDFQIAAGSVPRFVRNARGEFPQRRHFLLADAEKTAEWRARFAALGAGLKVGISWRAGGKPAEQQKRTTELAQWRDLFALGGVRWINLQYGEMGDEIAAARRSLGVEIHDFSEGDPLIDLDGFAAKLSGLDLVISVGNATVHMAGALGVPAWTLLPPVPAWRWLLEGSTTPWYASVQLYRQASLDNWQPVFARLRADFEASLAAGKPVSHMAGKAPLARDKHTRRQSRERQKDHAALFHEAHDTKAMGERVVPSALAAATEQQRKGNLAGAEEICRDLLQLAPRNAEALHMFGLLAWQSGRLESAINSLRRAVACGVNEADHALHLGCALRDAGRLQESVVALKKAVAWAPDRPDIRLALGKMFRATQNLDAALGQFQAAARLRPEFAAAHHAIARVLLDKCSLVDALAACERALDAQPEDASIHHTQGLILAQLGQFAAAQLALRMALSLQPGRQETLEALATLEAPPGASASTPAPNRLKAPANTCR